MTPGPPLDEFTAAADNYNFRSHYLEVTGDLRKAFRTVPIRVGTPVPAASLLTLEGETVELAEFQGGRNVALVFGSYSAPPCTLVLPEFEALSKSLAGSNSLVLFIYTREIHPGESVPPRGYAVARHESMEDKLACARLLREEFSLTLPILVDPLTGPLHRAFGGLPFQAAVLDRNGIVSFRSEWAAVDQLAGVLHNLEERDRVLDTKAVPKMIDGEENRWAPRSSVRNSYYEGLWGIDASTWH